MNSIFIGGSRHVSRLPAEVKKRIDNIVASGHQVLVGDASGADKAVQQHLLDARYEKVTVFCSGDAPRHNLGHWRTHHVAVPKGAKGFHFYAAKDREMARAADFGLMIWDGKSPGTVLNVLRLVQVGKISVIFRVADKTAINIRSADNWRDFLSQCSPGVVADIKERATEEEWALGEPSTQPSLLSPSAVPAPGSPTLETPPIVPVSDEAVLVLNRALASGDPAKIMETLGFIARDRGMSQVARESGLPGSNIDRSLASGHPEFATVLKVLYAIGLRLEAKLLETITERPPVPAHHAGS